MEDDVIVKSFETLVLLAVAAAVVLVASKFVGNPSSTTEVPAPNPLFRTIRNATLAILIASSALLAFLGVLTIWEIITSSSVLEKSLTTLGIVAFASLIVVMVCLEREQNPFWFRHKTELSWGSVIGSLIFIWIMALFLGRLF